MADRRPRTADRVVTLRENLETAAELLENLDVDLDVIAEHLTSPLAKRVKAIQREVQDITAAIDARLQTMAS